MTTAARSTVTGTPPTATSTRTPTNTPTATPTSDGCHNPTLWGNEPALSIGRTNATGAVVNDRLYVIGGSNGNIEPPYIAAAEKFNPYTNSWSSVAPIPTPADDMGADGYAEFHRGFLVEYDRDALIIDVRVNGGGHVSGLLLEKLARKRVGYDFPRWAAPKPYPDESPTGPMVALTNELAGSDGDIFSHTFKLMKLGPLVGKRTWGGVIGIWPRHRLVDGTVTTQPEFSFFFDDVGWRVENYGTDPDIEVDNAPQDYARGADPQLDKAVEVALDELSKRPPHRPRPTDRPQRVPPRLPPRARARSEVSPAPASEDMREPTPARSADASE